MTRDEVQTVVFEAIKHVAPEAEPESVPKDVDFREELDIDSMDFLNFVIAVHEKTGIEIPERDYPKLSSLNKAVGYLQATRV